MTVPNFPSDFLPSLNEAILKREGKKAGKDRILFRCPYPNHEDRHPSCRWDSAKATFYCDICGDGGGALDLADLLGMDRPEGFEKGGGGRKNTPSDNTATLQHSGCTLDAYAATKGLSVAFLQSIGLSELTYLDKPAVRMPYLRVDGTEGAVRYRIQLEKTSPDNRFRWKKGTKSFLYGLHRLNEFRAGGEVTLVEGESDTQTLWFHGIPAIGLPGAGNWEEQRDAHHFDGFARINIVIEPDSGGAAVRKWLERSAIRDRAFLIDLGDYKDVSGLHLATEVTHA
ncbi:MAG: toprim domain-containing protein [Chloroflexota bacterium]|nr:toprim domain-containing protein [Chloroflexota bacterium]